MHLDAAHVDRFAGSPYEMDAVASKLDQVASSSPAICDVCLPVIAEHPDPRARVKLSVDDPHLNVGIRPPVEQGQRQPGPPVVDRDRSTELGRAVYLRYPGGRKPPAESGQQLVVDRLTAEGDLLERESLGRLIRSGHEEPPERWGGAGVGDLEAAQGV